MPNILSTKFYDYLQRTEFSKSHENQEALGKTFPNCTFFLATFLRNRREGGARNSTHGREKQKTCVCPRCKLRKAQALLNRSLERSSAIMRPFEVFKIEVVTTNKKCVHSCCGEKGANTALNKLRHFYLWDLSLCSYPYQHPGLPIWKPIIQSPVSTYWLFSRDQARYLGRQSRSCCPCSQNSDSLPGTWQTFRKRKWTPLSNAVLPDFQPEGGQERRGGVSCSLWHFPASGGRPAAPYLSLTFSEIPFPYNEEPSVSWEFNFIKLIAQCKY